jgi:DNA invertase Pin-like site-specific DNA recombinase
MADARVKGRFAALRGAGNPNNRLAEDDVRAIRQRHAAGESQRSIARAYGLHPSSINRIFNGTAWAWLGDSHGGLL